MARRRGVATTWWGKRWTGALEALGAVWRNRLPRGRTYAREGRVVGLTVESGRVTAYVVGSLPRPYEVVIGLRPLSERQWRKAIKKMVSRASYTARLLAGEMPDDIEDAFEASKVSLFPERPGELKLSCTCPDLATPCKHVAATHYALGEAFDYDPFLLFALRGHDRDEILAGLRAERAAAPGAMGTGAVATDAAAPGDPSATSTAADDRFGSSTFDDASEDAPPFEPDAFASWRGEVGDLGFKIQPPPVRMALLRSLGKPPGWREAQSLSTVLEHAYEAASSLACRIALGDDEDREEDQEDECEGDREDERDGEHDERRAEETDT